MGESLKGPERRQWGSRQAVGTPPPLLCFVQRRFTHEGDARRLPSISRQSRDHRSRSIAFACASSHPPTSPSGTQAAALPVHHP